MKSSGNGERVPLRTVLQNFLNHVETLEKRKNGGDDQYDKEFQELKILGESLKGMPMYSCSQGEKEVNRRKNRYKDILPFDYTRVSLSEITGIPGSDYINANYIRGASGSHAYIASQGPLIHTVADFWRMVVECDVQVVVMACNEEESGKHKCECYWADNDTEIKSYGPYSVKLLKARRMCNDFNLRTMELSYINAAGESVTRTVVQFHYWAWPDHGVPTLVRPLLDMVRLIRDCQASETLPLLIHCSAGCGRTGTICAIDYVWGLLRAGKLTENFSLFDLIADMRRQRVAMVQTKDQYILVHRALRELFIEQLKMIDAHPYENLDINGHPLICPSPEIRIDPNYETIFVEVNPTDISEVNEEDDVCHEEAFDQIPWPVLQYQSMLSVTDRAPPLPDKKRKSSTTPPVEESPPMAFDKSKTNESISKESTPSSSLDRLLVKTAETDAADISNEMCVKENKDEESKQKLSPKSSLVRKSSILKIRSFFEKSHSEPRSDKKTKSTGPSARKANSFRVREEPSRFYRSLEEDSTNLANQANRSEDQPQRREQTKMHLTADVNALAQSSVDVQFTGDDRPSLPIKRSKSFKIYRSFDVGQETSNPSVQQPKEECESVEPIVVANPCDIILSKTPSITYISSKEKLHLIGKSTSSLEPIFKSCPNGDQLDVLSVPLATGSLDRAKEQRVPKSTATTVCGSLDRAVASTQNKLVPTYVNVLIRNQEVANTSKLDDGTQDHVLDCNPQDSNSEGNVAVLMEPTTHCQRSTPHSKKSESRSLRERRHSFKHAVTQESDDESSTLRRDVSESSNPSYAFTDGNSKLDESERATKKVHEYEAIWLSGSEPSAVAVCPEQNHDNSGVGKDSVFTQKSNEIRLLLNELRNTPTDEPTHTPSPNPVSPRLHPDRVLIELQELVERANRSKNELMKSTSDSYLLSSRSSPSSPNSGHKLEASTTSVCPSSASGFSSTFNTNSGDKFPSSKKPSSTFYTKCPEPVMKKETKAPAFRPPPPYPTNLYVQLPPISSDPASCSSKSKGPTQQQSPHRRNPPTERTPPEYKAPPPVKRTPQSSSQPQPVAPPRSKRHSTTHQFPAIKTKAEVAAAAAFPKGPPIPVRTFSSAQASAVNSDQGIDVDAVAAIMAAAETCSPKTRPEGSSSPSTAANKALSKALGKFHATAASFKTKLAQFSEVKEGADPSGAFTLQPKLERESSFVKPAAVFLGDGVAAVNSSETTTYARKKQQYL